MKNYDPIMSFGEDAAGSHDQRGDELAAVSFLDATGGAWSRVGARDRHRSDRPAARGSGIRVDGVDISPRWSNGSAPSRAAIGSR